MAETPPQLPWLYPYREDAQSTRLGDPVFRPFVPVSLVHGAQYTWSLTGLIDSGADAILASDLLTEQLGIDLSDHEGNVGFLDHFTVIMSRFAQALAVEERTAFDERYGAVLSP